MTVGNDLQNKHISVLLEELVDAIDIFQDKKNVIVDATLGMGGHASRIIQKMNKGDIFVGFDADEKNLELAKKRINSENIDHGVQIEFIHANFGELEEELTKRNIDTITGIYYDLGLSSLHLDEAERGFSFMQDGPLDMRLDKSKGITAAQIVNGYTQADLRKVFLEYGEEPGANKISAQIVEQRKQKKFNTTLQLAEILPSSPKTRARVFQALRIEANQELQNIEKSLQDAIKRLETNGNIFVISFHSLEDRVTKKIFKRETRDCICSDIICSCHHKKQLSLVNKKPIIPTPEEKQSNPRSRSAKARHAKKI